MVTFLGIDLSWSMDPDPRSSGACVIEDDQVIDLTHVGGDQEILDLSEEYNVDYVGIDAPLKVPNEEGSRPVEKELAKRGRPAYPANRGFFNRHYGGVRGERLVKLFKRNNYPFIERTQDQERGVIEDIQTQPLKPFWGRYQATRTRRKER